MSKYNPLWEYVQKNGTPSFKLTFEEIQSIAGLPIDHSFLKYKKELADYSYEVGKNIHERADRDLQQNQPVIPVPRTKKPPRRTAFSNSTHFHHSAFTPAGE